MSDKRLVIVDVTKDDLLEMLGIWPEIGNIVGVSVFERFMYDTVSIKLETPLGHKTPQGAAVVRYSLGEFKRRTKERLTVKQ